MRYESYVCVFRSVVVIMASKGVLDTKHILKSTEKKFWFIRFWGEFNDSDYEEEIIEEAEYNSNSEEEASDDYNESNDDEISLKRFLLAKTGAMWQETPFCSNVRRSTKSTVTTQPGPVDAVKNFKKPLDMFSLLVTATVIAKITDHANQKLE